MPDTDVLRVAVVGAGPAGLYVADSLTYQTDVAVRVDVFDRLPTPFGLLRYGVAPDHLKMKSLTRALQRTLDHDGVRFYGGVDVGSTVTVQELRSAYHAVVYTFGASRDRHLDIPGETLPGSASATDFVTWYSGHPDVAADAFDLGQQTAVVVGVGNVAVDVARVLVKDVDALATTDIPAAVLDVLRSSRITDVHMLGRRGPVQARFTHKELVELGELTGVDVIVDPADLVLAAADEVELGGHPALQRNLDTLTAWSQRPPTGAARRLHLHFWTRPVELVAGADGAVGAVRLERTALQEGRLVAISEPVDLPAQLVLRSVGYRGVALPGVPLDTDTCTVPSVESRVLRDGPDGPVSAGEYVAGWIGRGPVGVLGTNRSDATHMVERLLADVPALLASPPARDGVDDLLAERGAHLVDLAGWGRIDAAELALGAAGGRPRAKLATWGELHAAAAQ